MSETPQMKTLTINGKKYIVASETDPTLSFSGKAADAKSVGDAIGKVETAITTYRTEIDRFTGDVETALDSIIAIQNSLIGGDGV